MTTTNRRFLTLGVRWFVAIGCLALCKAGSCQELPADTLGRTLPTHEQCGPPRADRFVGIF
jgi:hypothetical protein